MAAPAVQTTVAGADLIEEARRERPELFQRRRTALAIRV